MKLLSLVSTLLCASGTLAASSPHKFGVFKHAKPVMERRVPDKPFTHPEIQKRATSFFATDKTKPFSVNGTNFPDVPFDIGESYAGL